MQHCCMHNTEIHLRKTSLRVKEELVLCWLGVADKSNPHSSANIKLVEKVHEESQNPIEIATVIFVDRSRAVN